MATLLLGCAQNHDGPVTQQYAHAWCMQLRSLQRLDSAFHANNVAAITTAARQVAGNATQVVEALTRRGWPTSARHDIQALQAGELAVAGNARAIAAQTTLPDIHRVPAPPHERIVGLYEADQSLRTRVNLHLSCSG